MPTPVEPLIVLPVRARASETDCADWWLIVDAHGRMVTSCQDEQTAAELVRLVNAFCERAIQSAREQDERIEELEKTIALYQSNLGDIVTYGTTADMLDKQLAAWVPRARESEAKLAAVREIVMLNR